MRKSTSRLLRQLAAAAVVALAAGKANAADLTVAPPHHGCAPREVVVLYDKFAKEAPLPMLEKVGHPTVPARTPYYYCVTGTTLTPRQVPPPPEYCCG